MYRHRRFSTFARAMHRTVAQPATFVLGLVLSLAWLVTQPVWRGDFSGGALESFMEWAVTVVAFLLLFLIEHTQWRESSALHLKLNELIRASPGAHNALLDIEELRDRDYDQIKRGYMTLARTARKQLQQGEIDWATAVNPLASVECLLDPLPAVQHPRRLDALRKLGILDTPTDERLDRLTQLAAKLLRAPVALVSLVDEERQWFKSSVGLSEPYCTRRETPLSHSFCQHVVALHAPLVVRDARGHPELQHNLAVRDLDVVAYLGVPLRTELDQEVVGSFCVIDSKPREWQERDLEILTELAEMVMREIEQSVSTV